MEFAKHGMAAFFSNFGSPFTARPTLAKTVPILIYVS
jgi:hypothetical protein